VRRLRLVVIVDYKICMPRQLRCARMLLWLRGRPPESEPRDAPDTRTRVIDDGRCACRRQKMQMLAGAIQRRRDGLGCVHRQVPGLKCD
jgi:hypothetical protein